MNTQIAQKLKHARKLRTFVSRDPALVKTAQQLRYSVFSVEYGSDLGAATPGIDADRYDAFCDHLMVIDENTGALVATTRILRQEMAEKTGGFYSQNEFDLSAFDQASGTIAELGRTCVHPDYRNGGTISMLWAGIAEYLVSCRVDYLIGCASISMSDGGLKAWRIAQKLQREYLADDRFRVTPKRSLPHLTDSATEHHSVDVPPLLKAYMRLGAKVCGEPCWDPDFRCADMLVVLTVSNLAGRYSRHFRVNQ